jgi:glycosyltransferase involved in cell wall biosynthesis
LKILGVLSKSYRADRPKYISGVDFWRVERPLLALQRLGWDVEITRRILPDDAKVGDPATERALVKIGSQYDLLFTSYFSSEAGARAYAYLRVLEDRFGLKFAMDLDDDFRNINKVNPAAKYFEQGTRERHILERIVQDVDNLTVTCQPLANRMRSFRADKPDESTTILPNFIDETFWPITRPPKSPRKTVRIVYMGSSHHHQDLYKTGFVKAVMRLLDAYENVEFHCVGMPPINPKNVLPDGEWGQFTHERLFYNPGGNMGEDYAQIYKSMRPDIYCAPLEASYFNAAKSSIKHQEAGLSGGAFVASDVTPYDKVVRHDDNGILVSNTRDYWYNALADLVENPSKRRRLAEANQIDVLENWALGRNIHRYAEYFERVMAKEKQRA